MKIHLIHFLNDTYICVIYTSNAVDGVISNKWNKGVIHVRHKVYLSTTCWNNCLFIWPVVPVVWMVDLYCWQLGTWLLGEWFETLSSLCLFSVTVNYLNLAEVQFQKQINVLKNNFCAKMYIICAGYRPTLQKNR